MIPRALLSLLLLASCAVAQDSPGFRGAARDGKITGFKAPAAWPKELPRGWQVEIGEGHSTPALVDGKLYAFVRQGEDEVILALEAATGKELWREKYPAPFEMNSIAKSHGKGPWSSPTVADGRVFTFGMGGILSCVDAKGGKVVWRKDFQDRATSKVSGFLWYGNALSPLVTDGQCIVHVFGATKGAIMALDSATGNSRWTWEKDEPAYASPILAAPGGKKQIIAQTMYKTVGLSLDGKLLWQVDFKTNYEQNSVTPVVFEDLVILSGTAVGVTAYKVGGEKPEQAWQTADVSMYMASPVLKGNLLFGHSEKRKGQFFCLDAKDGKTTLWTSPARQGESAALLLADDVVLALTTDAQLVVFDASGKEYAGKPPIKVADSPTWAHPVVSGKSIFIKDKTKLTQWTLP